jgi:hypothetical protein
VGFFSASLNWNRADCHGDDAVDNWANFSFSRRVAKATINDKDVWMPEGIAAAGQLPLELYFDQSTGLLVRAFGFPIRRPASIKLN